MIGLLVGDALGVPYEFHPAPSIPPAELIETTPPEGFSRAHPGVAPGTYSDDGAHALGLLASLLDRGELDLEDLAARLTGWLDNGELAVDGRVFDVGMQTQRAIARLKGGIAAHLAGPAGERDNGNGSLMRVLPLALWHRGSDRDLVADARRQSLVTHGHVQSQLCCALYCLWIRRALEDSANPWSDATATLRALLPVDEANVLNRDVRPEPPPKGQGSGYVVDCLRSARDVATLETFEAIVKAAVALGDDTDTTAAVAGGFAGARFGLGAIPQRWRSALRGREIYAPLILRLADNAST